MSDGHAAPSGQLDANHNIACSNLPVCRSAPPATKFSFLPSLKMIVDTRERESPLALQKASATASNSSVMGIQRLCGQMPASVKMPAGINPLRRSDRCGQSFAMTTKPPSAAAVLKRIDRRLAALGLTDNSASEQAGSRDTIRSIRKNVAKGVQRGVSTETLERLAPVLKTTAEWLSRGVGPEEGGDHIESGNVLPAELAPNDVEIVGYVGAGGQQHKYAVGQGSLDRAPRPSGATDQTVAVEIRGTSLGKPFDRWLVYYDDVRSPITDDLVGQLCVVGIADDRVLIKIVRRGKDGLFNLVSNIPDEPTVENVALEWAALVNDIRRRR